MKYNHTVWVILDVYISCVVNCKELIMSVSLKENTQYYNNNNKIYNFNLKKKLFLEDLNIFWLNKVLQLISWYIVYGFIAHVSIDIYDIDL